LINKIGLEKEFWLLNNEGDFHEPKLYDLPYDEFGFLVELRTKACTNIRDLMAEYEIKRETLAHQASYFALILSDKPTMPRPDIIDIYYAIKYKHDKIPDLTANIYVGVVSSHATGIFEAYLTAGLHVHFSRYDSLGRRVQLPIETIVKKMDWNFKSVITKANRILGEYEIKPYGFEYRSLPANTPIEEVVKRAFKILESV